MHQDWLTCRIWKSFFQTLHRQIRLRLGLYHSSQHVKSLTLSLLHYHRLELRLKRPIRKCKTLELAQVLFYLDHIKTITIIIHKFIFTWLEEAPTLCSPVAKALKVDTDEADREIPCDTDEADIASTLLEDPGWRWSVLWSEAMFRTRL